MTLPPPLTTPVGGRDDNFTNLEYIRAKIILTRDEDTAKSHQYESLQTHYTPEIIQYYDIISMGFYESARLLASEIQFPLAVGSYLDLGCGTGLTTEACIQRLIEQ